MARPRRRPHTSLIADLYRHPEAYAFFQGIRILERASALAAKRSKREPPDPVGRGVDPKRAPVFIRSAVSLGYAATEITALREVPGQPTEMTQTVVGLTGASGAMPHAFSELVQVSVRERKFGLREFLDLFNDRLAALLYDSWARHRLPIEMERRELPGAKTSIDSMLRSLVGIGLSTLTSRMAAPDSLIIHYGGLLGRQSRSAAAVEQVLSGVLGHTVRVEQFSGGRLSIAPSDQTRLPDASLPDGAYSRLGEDTVLGERTWNVEGEVRILIGPLSYHEFDSFLPHGSQAQRFADLAAFALGPDISFTVKLTLRAAEVPPMLLDPDENAPAANRLGWNTWMGWDGQRRDSGDVEFRPVVRRQTHAKNAP